MKPEKPTVEAHAGSSTEPAKEKRNQNILRFRLQPGDDALLQLLPNRQRELLETKGSYKEKAAKLGVPVGTVRSGLHRARVALERLRENVFQSEPNSPIP